MTLPLITALAIVFAVSLAACGGNSAPPAPPAPPAPLASDAGSMASAGTTGGASEPASGGPTASGEADPCLLVTRAQAEAQAGGAVTLKTGALPGPPGEGSFCLYTNANLEELEVRTAVGRGDYDNDLKLATGNEWDVADVPDIGDEAWTDKGPFLGSINVISHGAWVRISASLGFGAKPMLELPDLAKQAIGRLP